MKVIKKHPVALCVLLVVLYMVIGLLAPFIRYKEMDESARMQAEEALPVQEILEGKSSSDRAMLVETNVAALNERFRLIGLAEESILLSTYDMRIGESTLDLTALLLHKAEEGVKVKILVDGISGLIRMQHREEFYVLNSHPNVEIKLYNRINPLTPWKTQGRMHDKYLIVDEIGYLMGGRNTFDYFLGEYDTANQSFDREVLIYNSGHDSRESGDSSVHVLRGYFEDMWSNENCTDFKETIGTGGRTDLQKQRDLFTARAEELMEKNGDLFTNSADIYEALTYETEGTWLLSNPTDIYGKEPVIFYQLTELMKEAGQPVLIHTPYIVCNDYMYETLNQVHKAVPSLELMTNSVENGDNFFALGDYMRNKGKVLATGADIYEYDGGMSSHGKSVVIGNDISVIGSYNFDLRSTFVNTELMIVINSPRLTTELTGYLDTMKAESRHVIDMENYETEEGWIQPELPAWKRIAMQAAAFLMQPFRCLI